MSGVRFGSRNWEQQVFSLLKRVQARAVNCRGRTRSLLTVKSLMVLMNCLEPCLVLERLHSAGGSLRPRCRKKARSTPQDILQFRDMDCKEFLSKPMHQGLILAGAIETSLEVDRSATPCLLPGLERETGSSAPLVVCTHCPA
jgi:hypothetical protein